MQIAEERPPYVTFEVRAEEDRSASIEQGHYVAKDVVYALITPMGSKDRIERQADEWLEKLRRDVVDGRFKSEWLRHYTNAYKAFLAGQELPLSGTPIENWPPASPAIVLTLRRLQVRTVEDLAQANEEVLGRIGMGGRGLKQKALEWLESSKSSGRLVEALEATRAENASLKARLEALESRVLAAEAEAEASQSTKTSRKL